jgi:hypothetical protein
MCLQRAHAASCAATVGQLLRAMVGRASDRYLRRLGVASASVPRVWAPRLGPASGPRVWAPRLGPASGPRAWASSLQHLQATYDFYSAGVAVMTAPSFSTVAAIISGARLSATKKPATMA